MPRRVLIVPDKFKGTLTARAAAELIGQGWSQACPEDELELLPMSDGGDGFGEIMADLLPVAPRTTPTVDAAGRPHSATWWWSEKDQTAIIESARVVGLALLPPWQFHPFQLDTRGLGALFHAAAAENCRQCLVGIGGSATNDGGFGLARAIGWRFIDAEGQPIVRWTELRRLARINPPERLTNLPELRVAVDVQNPLLGAQGASRIYGPQKGLLPDDFSLAEACLERLAERVRLDLGLEVASTPGDGAAGGLGFGLRAFFKTHLESGFELFARYGHLEERIRAVNLVITGEGAIDQSTNMGKGVGEIAKLCRRYQVPCVGLAGTLLPLAKEHAEGVFTELYGIVPELAGLEEACARPEIWLPRLAAKVGLAYRSPST